MKSLSYEILTFKVYRIFHVEDYIESNLTNLEIEFGVHFQDFKVSSNGVYYSVTSQSVLEYEADDEGWKSIIECEEDLIREIVSHKLELYKKCKSFDVTTLWEIAFIHTPANWTGPEEFDWEFRCLGLIDLDKLASTMKEV